MVYKDPQKQKEYDARWYQKNRERILKELKEDPEKVRVNREKSERNRQKKREEALDSNEKFIEENGLVEHPRYNGYYGTKDSRVFSNKGAHGSIKELKPILQKSNNGYYLIYCGRNENGKKNQVLWHRFIAEIFIPNPNNLPQVNHLDEDKGNCRVDNLEWSTHLDNVRHSQDHWGRNFLIENLKTGERYEIVNLSKWCNDNGVNRGCVYECIWGNRLTIKKGTYKVSKIDGGG